MKEKNNSDFLVQGSILAAASLLSRFIGILYRIPVTNLIGEDGLADYGNAFEIYNIVLILSSFSLPLSVSKLVAARNVRREYQNSYRIFLGAMMFAITSGVSFTLILYFGADFFASVLFQMPSSAIPLKVLAPTILISAVMGVFRGYYQGKNTMLPTAFSQILEQIVNAIVSIVAAYFLMKKYRTSPEAGAYGAAGSTLGTCTGALAGLLFLVFVFCLYYPTIKRQCRRDRTSTNMSYMQIFALLFYTIIPVILSQTVYQLSGVIDNGLFGHLMKQKGVALELRKTMLGVYTGKYRLLTNLPVAIASAVASSMIPSIVAARVKRDTKNLHHKIDRAIHFNMLLAFPSAVGMTVLAAPLVQLLFPGSSPLAARLLQMGSIAIVFFALSTVSNAILQGMNLMQVPVVHSAISLVFHIVLVYGLLRFTDCKTYALVMGNISFALVVCILNWISIGSHLQYRQEVVRSFLLPAFSALGMGLITGGFYMGMSHLFGMRRWITVSAICVAIMSYFILLFLCKGVNEDELLEFPMGRTLLTIAKKTHLL